MLPAEIVGPTGHTHLPDIDLVLQFGGWMLEKNRLDFQTVNRDSVLNFPRHWKRNLGSSETYRTLATRVQADRLE